MQEHKIILKPQQLCTKSLQPIFLSGDLIEFVFKAALLIFGYRGDAQQAVSTTMTYDLVELILLLYNLYVLDSLMYNWLKLCKKLIIGYIRLGKTHKLSNECSGLLV